MSITRQTYDVIAHPAAAGLTSSLTVTIDINTSRATNPRRAVMLMIMHGHNAVRTIASVKDASVSPLVDVGAAGSVLYSNDWGTTALGVRAWLIKDADLPSGSGNNDYKVTVDGPVASMEVFAFFLTDVDQTIGVEHEDGGFVDADTISATVGPTLTLDSWVGAATYGEDDTVGFDDGSLANELRDVGVQPQFGGGSRTYVEDEVVTSGSSKSTTHDRTGTNTLEMVQCMVTLVEDTGAGSPSPGGSGSGGGSPVVTFLPDLGMIS